MKLVVKCTNCRGENSVPYYESNRIDYAKQHGDSFSKTCDACNTQFEYEVDDIRANDYNFLEVVKSRLVTMLIIFVLIFVSTYYYFNWFNRSLISSVVMTFLYVVYEIKNDSRKCLDFNSQKLKGRVSNRRFR